MRHKGRWVSAPRWPILSAGSDLLVQNLPTPTSNVHTSTCYKNSPRSRFSAAWCLRDRSWCFKQIPVTRSRGGSRYLSPSWNSPPETCHLLVVSFATISNVVVDPHLPKEPRAGESWPSGAAAVILLQPSGIVERCRKPGGAPPGGCEVPTWCPCVLPSRLGSDPTRGWDGHRNHVMSRELLKHDRRSEKNTNKQTKKPSPLSS